MALTIEERFVTHNTFVIERSYSAAPDGVFAAFADPAKKRRWFAEERENQLGEFAMDFRPGGKEHYRSRIASGPVQGCMLTNDGTYVDIVPNRRIVVTSTMALDDRRISASLATFELLPSGTGTRLIFTHQAAFFEGADGPQMREVGWRHLLERLAGALA
jgi:uncharacterized protein YndB with AHSA1/START domain